MPGAEVNDGTASPEAAAGADAIDPAILAVLPDDAPPGHEAYEQIRWKDNAKWPFATFVFNGQRFQVSLGPVVGLRSKEACCRIARACYLMFDDGFSVDDVKAYRKECYDRIKDAIAEAEGKLQSQRPSAKRWRQGALDAVLDTRMRAVEATLAAESLSVSHRGQGQL